MGLYRGYIGKENGNYYSVCAHVLFDWFTGSGGGREVRAGTCTPASMHRGWGLCTNAVTIAFMGN